MKYYSLKQFYKDMPILAGKIITEIKYSDKDYDYLYPVLRGGLAVALELSKYLKIPLTDDLSDKDKSKILIAEDLIDSGITRQQYKDYDFACIHVKQRAKETATYHVHDVGNEWIEYWWEKKYIKKEN